MNVKTRCSIDALCVRNEDNCSELRKAQCRSFQMELVRCFLKEMEAKK